MSSVKGAKISDVDVANNTSITLTLSELNPVSNNTIWNIAIVSGGGDLAGSTLLGRNWKEYVNNHYQSHWHSTSLLNRSAYGTYIPTQWIDLVVQVHNKYQFRNS
jgi:hypothetical protein